MTHKARITSIQKITPDVLQIQTEKPAGIEFKSGQAVDMSINKEGWEKEVRPFTFTTLPEDDFLEFTIKTYPSHNAVTNELLHLVPGDELLLGDVFGDIAYKGKGIFIAGGAGITPFIAIFKQLIKMQQATGNKLIFANKTKADIIQEQYFKQLLGNDFINILSDEKREGYENGFINENFLRRNINDTNQYFYLCGPPPMMDAVIKQLHSIGVNNDHIVMESY